MSKKALILGIGGQDGSYLAELLLTKGYEVHGGYRRSSYDNLARISHFRNSVILHRCDLADGASIERTILGVQPTELYNLADQDHVGFSKETPEVSIDITAGSVQRLLEAVLRIDKGIKVFQPVSATMFRGGKLRQHEYSELAPDSPYAIAKLAARYLCDYYRNLGVWVACGIMFNHESPRRGPDYLLQRIVRQAWEVKQGKRDHMEFSNINMEVDIGYAPEYMEAVTRMLNDTNDPMTYCIGTGCRYSIHTLCEYALRLVNAPESARVMEVYPPIAAKELIADISKARDYLSYKPEMYGMKLVEALVDGGYR